MSDDQETADLTRALRSLRPTPGPSPSAVLYRAGRASVEPAVRFWRRLAVGGLTGLALTWAVGIVAFIEWRDTPIPTRIEYVSIPEPVPAAPPAPPVVDPPAVDPPAYPPAPVPFVRSDPARDTRLREYLRIRRDVLAHGIDALPAAPVRPSAGPATGPDSIDDLERDLGMPVGVLAAPYRFRQ